MADEDITKEAFKHLNKMLKKKPITNITEPNSLVIQQSQPTLVAGFMDSNGTFHAVQQKILSSQSLQSSQSSSPLKVEDKLNCPCLNCKLFGSHNPTQEERTKIMITYAQLIFAGIFVLGLLIIIIKLYIL